MKFVFSYCLLGLTNIHVIKVNRVTGSANDGVVNISRLLRCTLCAEMTQHTSYTGYIVSSQSSFEENIVTCSEGSIILIHLKYSKPRLSRTRLSRIFAELGQTFENG